MYRKPYLPLSNQSPIFLFSCFFLSCVSLYVINVFYVDYINEVLNETVDDDEKQNLPDDWEEGLTFTARSSRKYHPLSIYTIFHVSSFSLKKCLKLWLQALFLYSFHFSTNIFDMDPNSYSNSVRERKKKSASL